MSITIRKIVQLVEETSREYDHELERPHRVAVVAFIFDNPFPSEYIDDLTTLANEFGHELGTRAGPAVVQLLGSEVEAFGKGVLVGSGGEVEHGSALIHNRSFGDPFREAAGGTELLPAAEKRGLPGSAIDIPLKHKLQPSRSHYQTFTLQIADAPREREILVAVAAADGGRPLARPVPAETATA